MDYRSYLATTPSAGAFQYFRDALLPHYVVFTNAKSRDFLRFSFTSLIRRERPGNLDWKTYPNKARAAQARARLYFLDGQKSELLTRALLDIIHLCEDNRIQLVGIKFPLAKDYLALIGGRTFGAEAILKSKGIEILDFKNAFIERDGLFANQDHLNAPGGRLLSAMIVEALSRRAGGPLR